MSIIIANYNYARFLRRSIDSALEQKHKNVEVIVVDDASTDASREVIASYGDRIRSCFRAKNGGHAAAFNSGFAESSGAIVFFLDADDYLHPHAVSQVTDAWTERTVQMQWRLDLVDEQGRARDVFPPRELPFDSGDVRPKLRERGRYQTTVTSGLAFARTALEAIMPIPEADFRQGADGYLVTVAPLHGQVAALDRCLGAYRIHGTNHSVFGGKLARRARWRVEHDFHRMRALSTHMKRRGLTLRGEPPLRDPFHIEERLASYCLEKSNHPVRGDSRLQLAAAGSVASLTMPYSFRRRIVQAGWFAAVGILPERQAQAVLSWKLVAASRPKFLARLSKSIRRAMG